MPENSTATNTATPTFVEPASAPESDTDVAPDQSETGDATPELDEDTLKTERRHRRLAERRVSELQKSLEDAETKVKKYEDANKSEQQRAADELEAIKVKVQAAEAERDRALLDLMRREVGNDKGLPAYMHPLLQGSNREELEAHADHLNRERERENGTTAPKPRKPQPDSRLGRASDGKISTADQFAAALRNSF